MQKSNLTAIAINTKQQQDKNFQKLTLIYRKLVPHRGMPLTYYRHTIAVHEFSEVNNITPLKQNTTVRQYYENLGEITHK